MWIPTNFLCSRPIYERALSQTYFAIHCVLFFINDKRQLVPLFGKGLHMPQQKTNIQAFLQKGTCYMLHQNL
jgi:hypothetical protein